MAFKRVLNNFLKLYLSGFNKHSNEQQKYLHVGGLVAGGCVAGAATRTYICTD